METKVLGNSDLRITPIGFGAWAIGGDWEFGWGSQDDAQSVAAIHRALELGEGQKIQLIPPKKPRRGPYWGANTPIPVPLRSW